MMHGYLAAELETNPGDRCRAYRWSPARGWGGGGGGGGGHAGRLPVPRTWLGGGGSRSSQVGVPESP